mmetsp:Transcript_43075/g.79782  ORF Transcript_43075/g.79782 Transcript_43075/m.79782 type:complete len:84 (+) Transcript_43075:653-904(+)
MPGLIRGVIAKKGVVLQVAEATPQLLTLLTWTETVLEEMEAKYAKSTGLPVKGEEVWQTTIVVALELRTLVILAAPRAFATKS